MRNGGGSASAASDSMRCRPVCIPQRYRYLMHWALMRRRRQYWDHDVLPRRCAVVPIRLAPGVDTEYRQQGSPATAGVSGPLGRRSFPPQASDKVRPASRRVLLARARPRDTRALREQWYSHHYLIIGLYRRDPLSALVGGPTNTVLCLFGGFKVLAVRPPSHVSAHSQTGIATCSPPPSPHKDARAHATRYCIQTTAQIWHYDSEPQKKF